MRRNDVLMAVLVVALAAGLIFGPGLVKEWRERNLAQDAPETRNQQAVEPARPTETGDTGALDRAAEVERVSGMLMLYKACANRFDGFDREGRPVLESWKRRNAVVLERRDAALDFHIVLADPEKAAQAGDEKSQAEARALCERNLEAMRKDTGAEPGVQE